MKDLINAAKAATRLGITLDDAVRMVHEAMVEESLILTRGNQTDSAKQLGCNRQTVRKYVLTRQEKPMVGRWRENTGEQPIRKGKIQVEYPCGGTSIYYPKQVNWSLDLLPDSRTGFSEKIIRWRPWYA